jgi:hypothetical protein
VAFEQDIDVDSLRRRALQGAGHPRIGQNIGLDKETRLGGVNRPYEGSHAVLGLDQNP